MDETGLVLFCAAGFIAALVVVRETMATNRAKIHTAGTAQAAAVHTLLNAPASKTKGKRDRRHEQILANTAANAKVKNARAEQGGRAAAYDDEEERSGAYDLFDHRIGCGIGIGMASAFCDDSGIFSDAIGSDIGSNMFDDGGMGGSFGSDDMLGGNDMMHDMMFDPANSFYDFNIYHDHSHDFGTDMFSSDPFGSTDAFSTDSTDFGTSMFDD